MLPTLFYLAMVGVWLAYLPGSVGLLVNAYRQAASSGHPSDKWEPEKKLKCFRHDSFITGSTDLTALIETGLRFPTIYADPPWRYSNVAARGAAENHYPTMSLDDICSEPIRELADANAHLHLWTTNAFLREAFDVINAWGFHFKSCLMWIKPQLGMGNYWRVSHEYLLLGIRGSLPFRDNTCQSWFIHPRTKHSRKPFTARELIERVTRSRWSLNFVKNLTIFEVSSTGRQSRQPVGASAPRRGPLPLVA